MIFLDSSERRRTGWKGERRRVSELVSKGKRRENEKSNREEEGRKVILPSICRRRYLRSQREGEKKKKR